jgi:hypothetical protein
MRRAFFLALAAGAVFFGGCAHPAQVGFISPTPTPTPTATPGACATPDVTDTNVALVGVSVDMTPAKDPKNNSIFGYAPYVNGNIPPQTSAVVTVAPSQLVQFLNLEPSSSTLSHSAVGFTSSTFPTVPYNFPPGSDSQVGSIITKAIAAGASVPWSTGEIPASSTASTGMYCASQVFRAPTPGTYYFGDFNTYNSAASMRGEIIVSP